MLRIHAIFSFCILLILFNSSKSYCQPEEYNWYFGKYAAVNFNTGSPITLYNSAMLAYSSFCGSISDSVGKLLFYTDGKKVWNRKHAVMQNGGSVGGFIVQKPGSTNLYYLVDNNKYSVVDMNTGTDGSVILINQVFSLANFAGYTFIRHKNNLDIWMVAYLKNSTTFYSFLISSSGFNLTPVQSNSGISLNTSCVMKISPKGENLSKISNNGLELFDFNNLTGQVSNCYYLGGYWSPYCLEYSADGSKLYAGGPNDKQLYRFDLTAGSKAAIMNSVTLVDSIPSSVGTGFSAMQLGPDRKLYISISGASSLDVIDMPDESNSQFTIKKNVVGLGPGRNCLSCLPAFVQYYKLKYDIGVLGYCSTNITYFSVLTTDRVDSVFWNFGDPTDPLHNSSFLRYPEHIYNDTGNYTVTLIVYHNKIIDTTRKTITIKGPLISKFVINDTNQCIKENRFEFNFTGNLRSSISKWQWDFGDSTFSNLPDSVNHKYLYADTFHVLGIVMTTDGCVDTCTKEVIVNLSPTADFHVADTIRCLKGNLFLFTNLTTNFSPPGKWMWEFGDGSFSTSRDSVFHHFNNPDTFSIKLTAINQNICIDSIRKNVILLPSPDASWTTTDSKACFNGHSFTFNHAPPGYFKWDLGDGTINAKDKTITHSYNLPDTYRVNLWTINQYSCMDSLIRYIIVHPSPDSVFTVNNAIQCLKGNLFSFGYNPSPFNDQLNWDFGDGNKSFIYYPFHSYSTIGNYMVRLNITNKFGCKDSNSKKMTIYRSPDAGFSISDTVECWKGNHFKVIKNLPSAPDKRLWNFGDGKTSNSVDSLTYVYTYSGSFLLSLISVTSEGCKDSSSVNIIVKPTPVIPDISYNGPLCEDETLLLHANSTINAIYEWSADNGFVSSLQHPVITMSRQSDSGKYSVKAILDGCESDIASLVVQVNPKVFFELGTGKNICTGDNIDLDPGFFDSYLWQDEATDRVFHVYREGTYYVTAKNKYGCEHSDTIVFIKKCPTFLYIPAAFSPNNDGINDSFTISTQNMKMFSLYIFNRWGELLFQTENPDKSWDGTFKGTGCMTGNYYYHVVARDPDGNVKNVNGMVNLLR